MTRNIAVAAVLLLGTMSLAHAQGMGRGGAGAPGASQTSPGHQMQSGRDADDRGPGASGYSPGHEMRDHDTVGQSRGDRDIDRGGRQSFGHDRDDDHRTVGRSRGDHDFDRDRGDRDRGASEFSPGSRMHEGGEIDRR